MAADRCTRVAGAESFKKLRQENIALPNNNNVDSNININSNNKSVSVNHDSVRLIINQNQSTVNNGAVNTILGKRKRNNNQSIKIDIPNAKKIKQQNRMDKNKLSSMCDESNKFNDSGSNFSNEGLISNISNDNNHRSNVNNVINEEIVPFWRRKRIHFYDSTDCYYFYEDFGAYDVPTVPILCSKCHFIYNAMPFDTTHTCWKCFEFSQFSSDSQDGDSYQSSDSDQQSNCSIDKIITFHCKKEGEADAATFQIVKGKCSLCNESISCKYKSNAQSHHAAKHTKKKLEEIATTKQKKIEQQKQHSQQQQQKQKFAKYFQSAIRHETKEKENIKCDKNQHNDSDKNGNLIGFKESGNESLFINAERDTSNANSTQNRCLGAIPMCLIEIGANKSNFLAFFPTRNYDENKHNFWVDNHGCHSHGCFGSVTADHSNDTNNICLEIVQNDKKLLKLLLTANKKTKFMSNAYRSALSWEAIEHEKRKTQQKNAMKKYRLEIKLFNRDQRLTCYRRCFIYIATKDIPKLRMMCAQYGKYGHHPRKLLHDFELALRGLYSPTLFSKRAKQAAGLTMAIGGSMLVQYLCRAGFFPSCSTVRKIMNRIAENLKYHPRGITTVSLIARLDEICFDECRIEINRLQHNNTKDISEIKLDSSEFNDLVLNKQLDARLSVIQTDEMYTDKQLMFQCGTGFFVGMCANHYPIGCPVIFSDLNSFLTIKKYLERNQIHLARGIQVYNLTLWDKNVSVQNPERNYVICVISVCGKVSEQFHYKQFKMIQESWNKSKISKFCKLLTTHSDGDGSIRKDKMQLYSESQEQVEHDLEFVAHKWIGFGGDDRHEDKRGRIRCQLGYVLKDPTKNIIILGVNLDINVIYEIATKCSCIDIKKITRGRGLKYVFNYSHDKMNVKDALIWFELIYEITKAENRSQIMNMYVTKEKQKQLKKFLDAFSIYSECWYGYYQANLIGSLDMKHRLTLLFKTYLINYTMYCAYGTKWITNPTYFDVTESITVLIQVCIIVASNKKWCLIPVLIHLFGSNVLEYLFAIIRGMRGGSTMSVYTSLSRIKRANAVNSILSENPGWKEATYRLRGLERINIATIDPQKQIVNLKIITDAHSDAIDAVQTLFSKFTCLDEAYYDYKGKILASSNAFIVNSRDIRLPKDEEAENNNDVIDETFAKVWEKNRENEKLAYIDNIMHTAYEESGIVNKQNLKEYPGNNGFDFDNIIDENGENNNEITHSIVDSMISYNGEKMHKNRFLKLYFNCDFGKRFSKSRQDAVKGIERDKTRNKTTSADTDPAVSMEDQLIMKSEYILSFFKMDKSLLPLVVEISYFKQDDNTLYSVSTDDFSLKNITVACTPVKLCKIGNNDEISQLISIKSQYLVSGPLFTSSLNSVVLQFEAQSIHGQWCLIVRNEDVIAGAQNILESSDPEQLFNSDTVTSIPASISLLIALKNSNELETFDFDDSNKMVQVNGSDLVGVKAGNDKAMTSSRKGKKVAKKKAKGKAKKKSAQNQQQTKLNQKIKDLKKKNLNQLLECVICKELLESKELRHHLSFHCVYLLKMNDENVNSQDKKKKQQSTENSSNSTVNADSKKANNAINRNKACNFLIKSPSDTSLDQFCFFCGDFTMKSCQPELISRSGGAKMVISDCDKFVSFSYKPAANKKWCSNVPIKCMLCNQVVWKYAFVSHLQNEHYIEWDWSKRLFDTSNCLISFESQNLEKLKESVVTNEEMSLFTSEIGRQTSKIKRKTKQKNAKLQEFSRKKANNKKSGSATEQSNKPRKIEQQQHQLPRQKLDDTDVDVLTVASSRDKIRKSSRLKSHKQGEFKEFFKASTNKNSNKQKWVSSSSSDYAELSDDSDDDDSEYQQ